MNNVASIGFTPLHSAVWQNATNIDDIKQTLDILINDYKFRILIPCQNNDNNKFVNHKYETILGAIYNEENKLPIEIKNEIYNFIINKTHSSWYVNDFQLYINKLNDTIFNIFLNKILFIMNQYFNKAIFILFKNLMCVRMSNKLEIHPKIEMLAQLVISKPNSVDNELNQYFTDSDNNINLLENKIIDHIIENDEIWINKEISLLSEITNAETYAEINYKNLFSFYGSLYKKSNNKNKILDKIISFTVKNIKNVNKYIVYFILYSNIDLKNMNDFEKMFISNCITNYYDSKNIRQSINFETAFKILLDLQIIQSDDIMKFA